MQGKGQELCCAEHILETAPQGGLAFLPPCLAKRMMTTSCLSLSILNFFSPLYLIFPTVFWCCLFFAVGGFACIFDFILNFKLSISATGMP